MGLHPKPFSRFKPFSPAPVFAQPFRFKHLPRSHLTPIQLHPLFLQPRTISAWDPLASLSSNANPFFVIGTFAALKKSITYTNGVRISLGTEWCVFIVLLQMDGGGGQEKGEVCDQGRPVASSGNG